MNRLKSDAAEEYDELCSEEKQSVNELFTKMESNLYIYPYSL